MFVRGYGPASAQKETRIHPYARVPKTGWKYKGNGIRLQPPQNSASAGPRFVLNIRPIKQVEGILCGLRSWEPAPDFSDTHDALLWGARSIPGCSLALNFLIALRDLIVHDFDFQNQTGLVWVLFVSVE